MTSEKDYSLFNVCSTPLCPLGQNFLKESGTLMNKSARVKRLSVTDEL